MADYKFLTGDALGGAVCRPVFLPNDDWSVALLRGQLLELATVENWEKYGTVTPEAAAAAWFDTLMKFDNETECGMHTGAIMTFAGNALPSGYLLCDGAEYQESAYPELFAVISYTYGGNPGLNTFRVPDLQGRFIRGAERESDMGLTGGEDQHTLTVEEMPEHDHEMTLYIVPTLNGSNAPVNDVRLFAGAPYQKETTAVGGDEPHENRPPFVNLLYGIRT